MSESDEEWIADYLRLEFGEDVSDPKSVKASDIKHIGNFIINGIVTEYFSYPHSGDPSWVMIETIDERDCVATTNRPPPE
jgi:hypothetical protein